MSETKEPAVPETTAPAEAPPEGSVVVTAEAMEVAKLCLLYTSPSPRDRQKSRMPSSA